MYVSVCVFIETGSRNDNIYFSIFQICLLILSAYDSFDLVVLLFSFFSSLPSYVISEQ